MSPPPQPSQDASGGSRLRIFTLLTLALAVRLALFNFLTGDVEFWVIPWYDYLQGHGLAAFATQFPNAEGWADTRASYSPPYHYLLYVATLFDGFAPKLYLIKMVSVTFDLIAAAFVFRIVRLWSPRRASRAFFAVLFAPTLIANGAFWGQCDSIYSSLLIGSVYFSLRDKPQWAVMLLGVAFAFKAQAVFLLPYLLLLILSARVAWTSLPIGPLAYLSMIAPAALLGRPLGELLSIYYRQGDAYHSLSMNAPNLYYFVPDTYYATGVLLGSAITITASIVFAALPRLRQATLTPERLLLAATVSLAMAPFLLPKMHDRYFMPADLLSIALGFSVPRLWFVPVAFQVTSMLAYVPILSDSLTGYGGEYIALMPLAAILNVILVGFLAATYWRSLQGEPAKDA